MDSEKLSNVLHEALKYYTQKIDREKFYKYLKTAIDEKQEKDNKNKFEFSLEVDSENPVGIAEGLKEITDNTLIANVVKFEAFIFSVLKFLLQEDRSLIIKKIDSLDGLDKDDINTFLKSILSTNNVDSSVDTLIKARLNKLRSPNNYFKFLIEVTEISLDEDLIYQYYEIKATRDLIVHHNGVIDENYIKKSTKFARGKPGENIEVNQDYLRSAGWIIKRITWFIYSEFNRLSSLQKEKEVTNKFKEV